MVIYIDGNRVDPTTVTYNSGLNYGRFDADGILVESYTLVLDRDALINRLRSHYDRCVRELKHDDEITGERSELARLGWPTLDRLINYDDLFAETILTYLDRDLFSEFIQGQPTAKYVINSTERVELRGDNVLIVGRCFTRGA